MKRSARGAATPPAAGRVRIIGGSLRGSRIDVPSAPGLRPTSDRVRETLFNWLAPHLPGASCLDLFAGSGALGFEAASRGAAQVLMIERDARLADALRAVADRLHAAAVQVRSDDALAWLARPPTVHYQIIFIDPPFAADLLQRSLDALAPHLAEDAWIYVECGREQAFAPASDWTLHRQGATREVRYALYRRKRAPAATLPPDSVPQDARSIR